VTDPLGAARTVLGLFLVVGGTWFLLRSLQDGSQVRILLGGAAVIVGVVGLWQAQVAGRSGGG